MNAVARGEKKEKLDEVVERTVLTEDLLISINKREGRGRGRGRGGEGTGGKRKGKRGERGERGETGREGEIEEVRERTKEYEKERYLCRTFVTNEKLQNILPDVSFHYLVFSLHLLLELAASEVRPPLHPLHLSLLVLSVLLRELRKVREERERETMEIHSSLHELLFILLC